MDDLPSLAAHITVYSPQVNMMIGNKSRFTAKQSKSKPHMTLKIILRGSSDVIKGYYPSDGWNLRCCVGKGVGGVTELQML